MLKESLGEFSDFLNFSDSNQLQTTNPVAFRNCLQMLGEFVAKATMATGEPYRILIKPLLTSFDLLLNSKSLPDFILFTNLVSINWLHCFTGSLVLFCCRSEFRHTEIY